MRGGKLQLPAKVPPGGRLPENAMVHLLDFAEAIWYWTVMEEGKKKVKSDSTTYAKIKVSDPAKIQPDVTGWTKFYSLDPVYPGQHPPGGGSRLI
jgi:hypothetical protein